MADTNSSNDSAGGNNALTPSDGDQQTQAADGQQQPAARPSGWSMAKGFIIRCLIIYFISSMFRKGQTPAPESGKTGTTSQSSMAPATNLFSKGTVYDMYAYVSEEEIFSSFSLPEARVWMRRGLVYGDWTSGPNGDSSYVKSVTFPTPTNVQNNGSIYLHMYVVKSGYSPDPENPKYSKRTTVHAMKRLNRYKRKRFHTTVNLVTGKSNAHPDLIKKDNESSVQILSHWHPNMTVCILDDHTPWTKGSVPQPLDDYIKFDASGSYYYPVIYFNDYWNLNSEFQPVNETVKELNLTLTFHPISLFKWQMYAAQGMRNKWYSMFGDGVMPEETDEEQDSLKTMLVETNPYLLAMTIVVSIVHSVFEFLAFKNDIQFWKSRKSLEGLSVRSVFFNVFQSLIVVLYVLDNETNTLVRVSVGIGLLIEIWKIKKVMDVKIDFEDKLFGAIPKLKFVDKSTYVQSDTRRYDEMAFKYLSWLLFPLLACYCVYSLVYQEHKSIYSWVLSLLYGFLLTFGFIMMTPQLFINYKLKSVAHLPWRMLTYKALNTFIDDIFAFVIKMPTLYRIGCLRDDVIFFIYLYQKWIYPTDLKRMNEFGTTGDMDPAVNPDAANQTAERQALEAGDTGGEPVSNGTPKGPDDKKND